MAIELSRGREEADYAQEFAPSRRVPSKRKVISVQAPALAPNQHLRSRKGCSLDGLLAVEVIWRFGRTKQESKGKDKLRQPSSCSTPSVDRSSHHPFLPCLPPTSQTSREDKEMYSRLKRVSTTTGAPWARTWSDERPMMTPRARRRREEEGPRLGQRSFQDFQRDGVGPEDDPDLLRL